MKLLVILSVIAYGYADKLDRTYLPPPNAQTAGGSPGALAAPNTQSGSFGQGLSSSTGSFSQNQPSGSQSGAANFGQQGEANRPSFQPSKYGQLSGPSGSSANNAGQGSFSASQGQTGFGSGSNGFGQNGADGIQSRPTFGSSGFGQPLNAIGSSDSSAQKNGLSFPKGGSTQTHSSVSGSPSNGYDSLQTGITQSHSQHAGAINQAFGSGPTAYQAPQPERPQAAGDRNAEILKYVNENDGESYNYSYETSNGITAEETGVATNGVRAQGGYAYTGDDGYKYSITYTADENGYQPQGEHLPTPPPIPAEILKSIEENARAAAAGTQEGAYKPEEYESEGTPQQYNAGASSYNQPQGQIQGYPQGQSNNMIQGGSIFGNKGNSGQGINSSPSQFGQVQPNNGFNQVSNVPLGQLTKKSGQNFGLNGQTLERGQSNGYQYNQPQNSFGLSNAAQVSAGRQKINVQEPTTFPRASVQSFGVNSNQGASTFLSGQGTGPNNAPQGAQGTSKTSLLPTGTFKSSGSTYQTSGTNTPSSQFGSSGPTGSSRPSGSSGALEPTGPTKSFGQGQPLGGFNQQPFASNQPSLGASQPSKQSFVSSNTAQHGYQYGLNANQPAFGNEIRQGARPSSSFSQSSQQFGNIPSNSNLGSGPFGRPQNQENYNKPSLEKQIPSQVSQLTPFGQSGPGAGGSFAGSQSGPNSLAGRPQYQQNGNRPSFGGNVSSQGSQLTPSSQYGPSLAGLSGPRESQQNRQPSLGSAPIKGPSGSEFDGPRQPPSFSPQEGYKY